jgi:hypothetical protein
MLPLENNGNYTYHMYSGPMLITGYSEVFRAFSLIPPPTCKFRDSTLAYAKSASFYALSNSLLVDTIIPRCAL